MTTKDFRNGPPTPEQLAAKEHEQPISMVLHNVQQALKAPKSNRNEFGKYNYRSAEDIVEAVKPLLPPGVSLLLSDDIKAVGDYVYVIATATLVSNKDQVSVSAGARDPIEKKGSDASQNTGAASSYARKYAMNGLFAIDDTKDADATNTHDDAPKKQSVVADGNYRSGSPMIDKWVNDQIGSLRDAVDMESLRELFGDIWKTAKKDRNIHADQLALIQEQYEMRKDALAAKAMETM